MDEEKQKGSKSTTVRIYKDAKQRLQKVVRHTAAREEREVTEAELVSEAVSNFCERREKKLGIS